MSSVVLLLCLLLPLLVTSFVFRPMLRQHGVVSQFMQEFDDFNDDTQPPLNTFIGALRRSLQPSEGAEIPPFLKLVLTDNKQILDSDNQKIKDVKLISARLVNLQIKGLRVQVTYKYTTNDQVKNYQLTEIVNEIETSLVSGFRRAILTTSDAIYELNMKRGNGKFRETKKSNSQLAVDVSPLYDLNHDRKKNVLIGMDSAFLKALKVTTVEGKPRSGMTDKYKQINKFVEIIDNLMTKVGVGKSSLNVVDMGCGMGYLTFAMHEHFSKSRNTTTTGVEARDSLVSQTNKVAASLGPPFTSQLHFVKGTISEYDMQRSGATHEAVNVLVALHACNTATDDAIQAGISNNFDVIITAPCCHKEVRPQLDAGYAAADAVPAYASMLRHNIYRERTAEMLTDSIRALVLEDAGYDVTVFEFIGGEHTAKNVMITAIKRDGYVRADHGKQQAAVTELMKQFGITKQSLVQSYYNGSAAKQLPLPKRRSQAQRSE